MDEELADMSFGDCRHPGVPDTGRDDRRGKGCAGAAREAADRLHMAPDRVEGGIHLPEYLAVGKRGGQFPVADKGHKITHGEFPE